MSNTAYSVGTVSVTNGGTTVTGSGTRWVGVVYEGDLFTDPAQGLFARVTADATDDEELQINAWPGTALSGDAYEVLFASDAVRQSERTRQLLEQLSVVQANGRGLFFRFTDAVTDADHGPGLIALDDADLTAATEAYIDNLDANGATISGVLDSWDDQGTASARGQLWLRSVADPAAFHAFRVTGSTVDGTGYRKLTLVYVGGSGSFAAGDELMVMFSPQGADGSNAILGVWQGEWQTATVYDDSPDADVVEHGGSTYICIEAHTSGVFATDLAAGKWDLAVEKGDTGATGATGATGSTGPQGDRGINWQGAYSALTAYVTDDGVLDNGSSWRALQATTGNAPPVLPTTSNAYWTLVAAKGTDGAGTGDVVGPASSVADRIALFNGTTGKLLKDSGYLIADLVPAGYSDLLTTVSLIALQVADNTNVALFLGAAGNRVADSFDALTYVDVAGATNADTGTAGLIKATTTGTAPSYANAGGTGARTGIITATGTIGGTTTDVTKLIDGSQTIPGNAWNWAGGTTSGYLQFDFGSPKLITEIKSYQDSTVTHGTWKVQGSNTAGGASGYVDIGTTFTLGGATTQTITNISANNTAYRYYRMTMVSGALSGAGWNTEMEFKIGDVITPNNLTIASASFAAASVPTKMKAVIRVKEVDAATAGTDYTLECSRDGGTTWSTMTLTELFTSASQHPVSGVVEAAETSVSGQPSGTSPRWRFKTLNNKNVELHDVYLYWS